MAEVKTAEKLSQTKNNYLKYMELKKQQPQKKEVDYAVNPAALKAN